MAEDPYGLIRERYERKALILTSNRALPEWPDAFSNTLLASPALDRLTHHCHVLVVRRESYRQRHRREEDRPPRLIRHTPIFRLVAYTKPIIGGLHPPGY